MSAAERANKTDRMLYENRESLNFCAVEGGLRDSSTTAYRVKTTSQEGILLIDWLGWFGPDTNEVMQCRAGQGSAYPMRILEVVRILTCRIDAPH